MSKLNKDVYLYDNQKREIKDLMNKDVEKVFIIQEKEVISYDWIVMGANNAKEALELYNEQGESYDEVKENGEKYNIFKVDDSWEYHRTLKPTITHNLKIRKCALNLNYDCEKIVNHDENVCRSCLRQAKINAGAPCDEYGEPIEGDE